ncbi:MAG: hypothetical protein HYT19_01730 [Candidatus Nealsonbacteria bacterium]|nr:hypothetical protein [Candidatus Nealsonbacteria bacterium]
MVYIFWLSGINLHDSIARVAFILLFLVLIIGPIMQLWRPRLSVLPFDLPWSWRGELGIWFTILSIVHLFLVYYEQEWQIRLTLASLLLWVVLFWALILTATSSSRVIKFLSVESWRWLHSHAYVIFYLASIHIIDHAFLGHHSSGDWFSWIYLIMIVTVMVLQFSAFIKNVVYYRKSLKDK